MENSWEFSVEDFFIRVLKGDSRSAGKNPCHFDEDDTAKSKALVVHAKQGAHSLAGPGGFEGEVEIEYRAPLKTSKTENDLVAKMLREAIYESTADLQAIKTAAGLEFIVIRDESSGDRTNSADLRKRTLTLPIQAKLA